MTVTVPDWLARRGGSLKLASDNNTWWLILNGDPVYTLVPRPVSSQMGCLIKQTNSGRPLESTSTAGSDAEALAAGLEDLRVLLGW